MLERHVLEELGVHQAGDALAHALVERGHALDLLLAGQHAVEPLAVDEHVDGRPGEDETRARRDGVEDHRIVRGLVDAELGDMLAGLVAARHAEAAFEQDDQIAGLGDDHIAGGTRFHARNGDQVGDGLVGQLGKEPRALELGDDGFHGRTQ